jgi:hypothetical protein
MQQITVIRNNAVHNQAEAERTQLNIRYERLANELKAMQQQQALALQQRQQQQQPRSMYGSQHSASSSSSSSQQSAVPTAATLYPRALGRPAAAAAAAAVVAPIAQYYSQPLRPGTAAASPIRAGVAATAATTAAAAAALVCTLRETVEDGRVLAFSKVNNNTGESHYTQSDLPLTSCRKCAILSSSSNSMTAQLLVLLVL